MMRLSLILGLLASLAATMVPAQTLRVATVTRPPFSMQEDGGDTGFSVELWQALAADMGRETGFQRVEQFGEMLDMVAQGKADAAIANISITAAREEAFDFTQPIFESGLQIMVHGDASKASIWSALFSKDILLAIALSFGVLFAGGMLMWRFERGQAGYFDQPAKQAAFPAFWWALNLVVNGGFEERVPRSVFGRLFGVLLVVSSLFVVSLVVAKITATLTVAEIQSSVNSVNDLYDKKVGTTRGSTASAYLDGRGVKNRSYDDLAGLLAAFETGVLEAVVFDAPILAYYVNNSNGDAALAGPVFLRENYGIVLPSGSKLAEPLNQSLLRLRENGVYDEIYRKWFGAR
jgi:polar amino acid transport system substrate-binding protein